MRVIEVEHKGKRLAKIGDAVLVKRVFSNNLKIGTRVIIQDINTDEGYYRIIDPLTKKTYSCGYDSVELVNKTKDELLELLNKYNNKITFIKDQLDYLNEIKKDEFDEYDYLVYKMIKEIKSNDSEEDALESIKEIISLYNDRTE